MEGGGGLLTPQVHLKYSVQHNMHNGRETRYPCLCMSAALLEECICMCPSFLCCHMRQVMCVTHTRTHTTSKPFSRAAELLVYSVCPTGCVQHWHQAFFKFCYHDRLFLIDSFGFPLSRDGFVQETAHHQVFTKSVSRLQHSRHSCRV